jgi:hypothetical protein
MIGTRQLAVCSLGVAAALAAGCGGSDEGPPAAKSRDARSGATGAIRGNQFLVFHDRPSGYSIRYPKGWTRMGSGKDVRFKNKHSVVHIAVVPGAATTPQSASAELAALRRSSPSLQVVSAPKQVTVKDVKAIKSAYTTQSTPDPVTGKRVTLRVDRYQLSFGPKKATIDLGTPEGVDNDDAYRLMIESFKWG